VFQILFFRNLFALPMILPTVLAGGGLATLATRRAPLHLLRGSVSVSGHLGLYWAIGFLALADVTAIQFTGPLMVTALSALVLHEAVGPRRWLAVIVGFAGVLIMVPPTFAGVLIMVPPTGEISLAALVVLAATLSYAVMVILTRVLTATETVGAIAFYQAAVGLTVGLSGLAWAWTTPSWGDFLLLALVGIWAGLAQLTSPAPASISPSGNRASCKSFGAGWRCAGTGAGDRGPSVP
jgi:drug/metabolite transporter (DMT)-like permease